MTGTRAGLEHEATSRILISELDSPAQRIRFDERGPRQAIIDISGMLRVGMLISRTVLLTDAMLLDGTYFTTLGPDRVLRELGGSEARYPLIITGTAATLQEGLDQRLRTPGFLWSLQGVEHDKPVPAAIREAWDQWIRYVDSGIIRYEQQKSSVPTMRLDSPPFEHSANADLIGKLALEPFRSRAWKTIDAAHLEPGDEKKILAWWNSGYLRMIAENAAADWVTFEGSSSIPAATRTGEIQLPTRLLEWAQTASASTVAVAWDSSRKQRERLRSNPSWARIRDLAYTATQVGAIVSRRSVLLDAGFKVLIAAVAILVAIPGLELSSIDHPLTWALFLGVVISTLPYDSLAALIGLLKRDSRTALILHQRESTLGRSLSSRI